jgi:hypothetical protein
MRGSDGYDARAMTPPAIEPRDADPTSPRAALPSAGARFLAFAAIVVAGLCGGLIGYAFTDLQTDGDGGWLPGLGGLVGAVGAAGGVAVVAVLTLRAMTEWRSIDERRGASPRGSR